MNPLVVLVGTKISGNIGAVARGMKNMGFVQLSLADPAANHLNREALDRAMEGRSILQEAKVYPGLKEAVAECQHVVGTSGKLRNSPVPLITPRELAAKWGSAPDQHWAIVFGPEDTGLKNEDLILCDTLISIPTAPEFPSLNISHAVMIVLYELLLSGANEEGRESKKIITADQRESLFAHWQEALLSIGFLDPKNPARIMDDIRHILNRAELDLRETDILRGIARQILNRCK
ncbi:MAG: RNA methyltransferase [Deltaproteobacteria bacterium]|nr:RNA methyltransferase [Deltaproteobacteria bacterium]